MVFRCTDRRGWLDARWVGGGRRPVSGSGCGGSAQYCRWSGAGRGGCVWVDAQRLEGPLPGVGTVGGTLSDRTPFHPDFLSAVPRHRVLEYADGGGCLVVVYLLLAAAIEYATPPSVAAFSKIDKERKWHEGVHDCSFGEV